jgi:predicted N-formylglutamate amidohydrolase
MPKKRTNTFLITCEHGGNRIPPRFRSCFSGHEAVLQTHRAYDPGALALARKMASQYEAPLISSTVSRLVIELNRSPWHRFLYSEFTRPLADGQREYIYRHFYQPYRDAVEKHIARAAKRGRRVIHISSHSFTPVLDGEARRADAGLLYDPSRMNERTLCAAWRGHMREQAPQFEIRMNYPYSGTSDGLTTYLRKRFGDEHYLGIELEVNQRHYLHDRNQWRLLARTLILALGHAASSLL